MTEHLYRSTEAVYGVCRIALQALLSRPTSPLHRCVTAMENRKRISAYEKAYVHLHLACVCNGNLS